MVFSQDAENVPVVSRMPEPAIGNNDFPDVQTAFDRQDEIMLCRPLDREIIFESEAGKLLILLEQGNEFL